MKQDNLLIQMISVLSFTINLIASEYFTQNSFYSTSILHLYSVTLNFFQLKLV